MGISSKTCLWHKGSNSEIKIIGFQQLVTSKSVVCPDIRHMDAIYPIQISNIVFRNMETKVAFELLNIANVLSKHYNWVFSRKLSIWNFNFSQVSFLKGGKQNAKIALTNYEFYIWKEVNSVKIALKWCGINMNNKLYLRTKCKFWVPKIILW